MTHQDHTDEGTISPAHLMQLILDTVSRNDRLIHDVKRRLHAMSTESQALLGVVTNVEASSAGLIGLAQALKAAADAGAASVAALAAEQAAHAATNADVVAATGRVTAVAAAEVQATTDNTPAP
jgi:hypothetical protein